MELKVCKECKEEKSVLEFYIFKNTGKYRPRCKKCHYLQQSQSNDAKIKRKNYAIKNKEKLKIYKKEYYFKNKDEIVKKSQIYYSNNKERIKIRKRPWNKEYYAKNKEKITNYRREYDKCPKLRLNYAMSRGVRETLIYGKCGESWINLVDYTVNDLIKHLESKFKYNMSWDNYGKNGWHIDHVIPKSYFKFDSFDHPAFKACWSLSNLQPLWATTEIAVANGAPITYIGNLDKRNNVKITKTMKKLLDSVNL